MMVSVCHYGLQQLIFYSYSCLLPKYLAYFGYGTKPPVREKIVEFQKHNQSLIGQKIHNLCFPLALFYQQITDALILNIEKQSCAKLYIRQKRSLKDILIAHWPNYFIYKRRNDLANNSIALYSTYFIIVQKLTKVSSSQSE